MDRIAPPPISMKVKRRCISFGVLVKFTILFRFRWLTRVFVRLENVPVELTPITVDDIKNDVYFYPWNRIHVYMIGMATGYVLFITKMKINMNKVRVWLFSFVYLSFATAYYFCKYVIHSLDIKHSLNTLDILKESFDI